MEALETGVPPLQVPENGAPSPFVDRQTLFGDWRVSVRLHAMSFNVVDPRPHRAGEPGPHQNQGRGPMETAESDRLVLLLGNLPHDLPKRDLPQKLLGALTRCAAVCVDISRIFKQLQVAGQLLPSTTDHA